VGRARGRASSVEGEGRQADGGGEAPPAQDTLLHRSRIGTLQQLARTWKPLHAGRPGPDYINRLEDEKHHRDGEARRFIASAEKPATFPLLT